MVCQARPVPPEDPDAKDLKAHQDRPARSPARLDPLDPQAHPDQQVLPVRKVLQERTADPVTVNPDLQEMLERLDRVVKRAHKVSQDPKARRASMELAITALNLVCLLGIRIDSFLVGVKGRSG